MFKLNLITMKKLLLSIGAVVMASGMAFAQYSWPGYTGTGVHDDFANGGAEYGDGTSTPPEGLYWWEDGTGVFTLGARSGGGSWTVTSVNAGAGATYPVFGVGWGDTNGDGTGTPYTVDLSNGANIELQIENASSTDSLVLLMWLEDDAGNVGQIEPDVSGVTTDWGGDRKAQNGIVLGKSSGVQTVTIELNNGGTNRGGLTPGAYTCSSPLDCPVTSYALDITSIVGVRFSVNPDAGGAGVAVTLADGDPTAEAILTGPQVTPFDGDIIFHDFKVGTNATNIAEDVIDASISVSPNPANDVVNVSFEGSASSVVALSDVTGSVVASATGNDVSLDVSGLAPGLYILSVDGAVSRKVIVE